MNSRTYYHILNIKPSASDADVRRAWKAQALRWHPDRNPKNRKQAEMMQTRINQAYAVLKTKPQREAYNRKLVKMSSLRDPGLRREGSRTHKRPDSRFRGNGSFVRKFFVSLREILWPFVLKEQKRHG